MELLIAFGVAILTQLIKKYVFPKWGGTGVQIVIFVLALIGTVVYKYLYADPQWQVIITQALETLAYAVALYEILLSKIGFNGGTKIEDTGKAIG